MQKIYKALIFLILLNLSFSASAHVQHYEDINRIEFDIYRNKNLIGKHVFSFSKLEEKLIVKSEINFEIKKFGIILYKYHVKGTEIYKNGELIKFNSKTEQNDKKKYVNLKLENGELIIDGSSHKGKVPANYLLGTWWNHDIVKAPVQISAVSGRLIEQTVTFLGKETFESGGKTYKALHFNFSSSNKKLDKGKKLNTDIWYDEKTLNWVKASFKKKGDWEYKLVLID